MREMIRQLLLFIVAEIVGMICAPIVLFWCIGLIMVSVQSMILIAFLMYYSFMNVFFGRSFGKEKALHREVNIKSLENAYYSWNAAIGRCIGVIILIYFCIRISRIHFCRFKVAKKKIKLVQNYEMMRVDLGSLPV